MARFNERRTQRRSGTHCQFGISSPVRFTYGLKTRSSEDSEPFSSSWILCSIPNINKEEDMSVQGVDMDLERGTAESAPLPNEQTPLLPTTNVTEAARDAHPETTASSAPEAIPASSVQRSAMHGFAGLGFASSLVSMMTEYSATAIQHPSIVVAGCLGLFLSPYAVFQQSKLTQVQALEQTNSVLQDEVRFLQEQQQTMQSHVQELQATEQRSKALQATLAAVQSQDAQSLQQLEQHVQESRAILAHMEQTAQANQLQTFITLLVNADADQNTILNSEKEVEQFLASLESTMTEGSWNREQIRQTIVQQKGSMAALMELARQIIANPGVPTLPVPTVSK